MADEPKVAIVCDWLTNTGGAEKVVLALHHAYPNAPIYTSVFDPKGCPELADADVRTTYLQKLPGFLRNRHQLFPVLRDRAFRKLNLVEYDIVISAASAEAKAVIRRPGALHICYCHTPTRYYWSHYADYKKNPGFGVLNPLIRLVIPPFVKLMRKYDLRAARGVDYFIANSTAVAERIKKYYSQDAAVIHPPIQTEHFMHLDIKGWRKGFIIVGRLVPYKRFDLAIEACNKLSEPLTVIYPGGSDYKRLKALAGPTITFMHANDEQKGQALARAEAFLFPQEEDFGVVQIEPLATGTPVIAYAKGGSLDVVKDGTTGVLFKEQTVGSLVKAIKKFKKLKFNRAKIREYSKQFSEERFIKEVQDFVDSKISDQKAK